MPHHALVTQSEGGVTQRWCESAKWISRPVLAADWSGVTPYTAKPPRAAVMWRSRYRCWASMSLMDSFRQQTGHIIRLSSSCSLWLGVGDVQHVDNMRGALRGLWLCGRGTYEGIFQIAQRVAVLEVSRPLSRRSVAEVFDMTRTSSTGRI